MKKHLISAAVNVGRIVIALTFIFSGYVKAIDPLGTQYKIHDYAQAAGLAEWVPDGLALAASIGLSAVEFTLGIFMLLAIQRRLASRLVLAFMVVMTALTVWIYWADPVADCGCFGDALKLSNGQTLLKNLVLLVLAIVVAAWPTSMVRFVSESVQWIVVNYTIIFILATSLRSLYTLPPFDFRPYRVGASLREGMQVPPGAPQPQFETTFILEKDGVRREFSLDDYPDSSWTFVDSKTVKTQEGYVPPIHDFSIQLLPEGDDMTDEVIDNPGYTFLLVSPHLEQADDANFGDIEQLYEYACEHDYPFLCLTASTHDAIARWTELTGAEYPFCATDETTLKTMIRSNPGLLLLKDGIVVGKWSHNMLPHIEPDMASQPLEQQPFAQLPAEEQGLSGTTARKVSRILLWFVLPLFVLVFADRTWAWTKWFRRKRNHKEE